MELRKQVPTEELVYATQPLLVNVHVYYIYLFPSGNTDAFVMITTDNKFDVDDCD